MADILSFLSARISVNYLERNEFWNWCQELNIECLYCGHNGVDKDLWYIKDEKLRALAILKWT